MVNEHKEFNDGQTASLQNAEFQAQVQVLGMKYMVKDERKKTQIKDGTYTPHTRANTNTNLGTTPDQSRSLNETYENLNDKTEDYSGVEIKDPKLKKINAKIDTAREHMADNIQVALQNTANLQVNLIF
jgi:predicted metal-dependent hydrolase